MIYNLQALENAHMFNRAYVLLNERMQSGAKIYNEEDMKLIVPVVINCAFSCELFIKAMLKTVPKKHTLDELFKALEPDVAARIQEFMIEYMGRVKDGYSDENFLCDLEKNGNAFYEWRYFHEGTRDLRVDLQFLSGFLTCLKVVSVIENTSPLSGEEE